MTKFLIALLVTVCVLTPHSVWAAGGGSEYVLKQNFADLGDQIVSVSRDAVRIDCLSHGFSVVCKAPDWRVYCFRVSEKKVWVSNLESFNGLQLLNPFSTAVYMPGEVAEGETVAYAGVKGVVLRPKHVQYWVEYVTSEFTDNAKVGEFLSRYYYISNLKMVPLYKKILAPENKRRLNSNWLSGDATADLRTQPRVMLATSSVKKIAYRAADFEIPVNYSLVHNANEILVSKADKVKIDDIVDSLGFTTDFDANAKAKAKH